MNTGYKDPLSINEWGSALKNSISFSTVPTGYEEPTTVGGFDFGKGFGVKAPALAPVSVPGQASLVDLNNRLSMLPGGNTTHSYIMPNMQPAGDRPAPRAGMAGWIDSLSAKLPNEGKNMKIGMQEDANKFVGGVQDVGATAKAGWDSMSFKDKGSMVLGAAQSVNGFIQARKASKLAQEQFNFTKDSFNRNFEASAKTTNAALSDRQAARHDRNPNKHASVADYMKKYGV